MLEPTHVLPDIFDTSRLSSTNIGPSTTAHDDKPEPEHAHVIPPNFSPRPPPFATSQPDKPEDLPRAISTRPAPLALTTEVTQNYPDTLSSCITTQQRELEKRHHATSRILKAPVGSALTTLVPTPKLPDTTRSPQFSGHDDNSERTSTLPFGAARQPSPVIPECQQLVSHAHHFFLHNGGPD